MNTTMTRKSPIIISVEGNIGAGKTTILDNLQQSMINHKQILFLREPVDIWETIIDKDTGDNILQSFYKNPTKYAFTFQVMAYSTRLSYIRDAINKHPDCAVIICERSLSADKNIFAQMLYDDGKIDDLQFQVYCKFYKEYACEFGLDGIIYIDASASKCHQRIIKRSRTGESTIELEYLESCKRYHDKWLINNKEDTILRIDTSSDVSYDKNDDSDQGIQWLCQIEKFIYSTLSTYMDKPAKL